MEVVRVGFAMGRMMAAAVDVSVAARLLAADWKAASREEGGALVAEFGETAADVCSLSLMPRGGGGEGAGGAGGA